MRTLRLPVLLVGLGLVLRLTAQTFTTLHNFSAGSTSSSGIYTNSDGAGPWAGLLLSSNTLYGTARDGGSSGYGTVFAVKTDGSGFMDLHDFTGYSEGANPYAG